MKNKTIKKIYNKGYSQAGASITKRSLKGFDARSGSPNEDINYNNNILRQRSRILMASGGVALSAINANRTNVVGIGLYPKSRINRTFLGLSIEEADEWQAKAEMEFSIWATNKRACDATGINDFYSMQQLVLTSWLASGDCFGLIKRQEPTKLMPYGLRIHVIEADRIATPASSTNGTFRITDGLYNGNRVYDGVEVSDEGLILAYHIRNNYPFENNSKITKWTRVPAYGDETGLPNILHVMNTERPEQYRGVPFLAPVIEAVNNIKRYTEAELMAAIIESFYTAFITTESEAGGIPFNEAIPEDAPEYSDDEDEYEMGPATTVRLKPGEGVTFGDPKRPNGGFPTFVRAVVTHIGAALEIPADLLEKAFNSSYSAARAALLEAWKAFRMRRRWFVSDFCDPVWEIWMYEAVARGRLIAPGFFDDPLIRKAYLGCTWIGPSQGMLDPTKEISAEVMACEYGLSTYSDSATRLNGSDWDGNIERLAVENPKLADAKVKTPDVQELINESIKEGLKTEEQNGENNDSYATENK